ncbi:hypothetical protein TNCV_4764001 [Trichonephila clavipes]|nr:hypothetical protein TNCV_4764001 [Trichonephila clavipes]
MLLSENVSVGEALAFYTLLGHVNGFLLADAFPILNHRTLMKEIFSAKFPNTEESNLAASNCDKVPPYR